MIGIVRAIGIAALILSVDPTLAANGVFLPNTRMPLPDAREAHFDNACALAGAAITMGVDSPTLKDDIRECANHFDGDMCETVRALILDAGKQIPPELKCLGKRAPNAKIEHRDLNAPLPPSANARYENACSITAANILNGTRENYEQNIADCARHPDKDSCEGTRAFISQQGKKIPPELICRGGG